MPKKKDLAKKHKKRSYTSKHSTDVIDLAVEALKKKTVSSYEAGKIFGIPRRTLIDISHNKHPNSRGCPTKLTDEEEANTIKVLIAAADYGSPLTLLDLRIVVYRYCWSSLGRVALDRTKLKELEEAFARRHVVIRCYAAKEVSLPLLTNVTSYTKLAATPPSGWRNFYCQ